MASVKRAIYDEWIPDQETYQNVAELKALALKRLTAAVVSSVQSPVGCQLTSTSFSDQPYRFQRITSTFSS